MQTLKSVTYNARLTRITEASDSCLLSILHIRLLVDDEIDRAAPLLQAGRCLSPDQYIEVSYLYKTSPNTFWMVFMENIKVYNKITFEVTPKEIATQPFLANIVNKLNLESWSSIEFNPQDDELIFVDAIESAL